jgi:predicted acyl esterase
MMPCRDGIKLETIVNYPRDMDYSSPTHTALMDRSPYGYGDMEWITDLVMPAGMVAVGQDMRGTEMSEGNFTMWQQDKDDAEDLGNWITSQTWSDGNVMTLGASADGLASLQTPFHDPAWLAAQYIIWAPRSMYKVLFPHGCYKQETTEDWLLGLDMSNPDVVYDNMNTVYENEAYNSYWKAIEPVFENVHGPNAFWAGWYDLFLDQTISAFHGYNTLSDPKVRFTSKITVDPLGHCLDGAHFFTENAVLGRTLLPIAQMFETYGIRPVARNNIQNVTFYVMSSNDDLGKEAGQFWTTMEEFPTPQNTDFFLHADHTSSNKPDTSAETSTSYKVDPADPILTIGGNNLPPDIGGSIHCGPEDQSPVDSRDDVLVFNTQPFEEHFYMTGSMSATLFVSSDAIDTDFMVKVSDLYPTGEAILIQDNAFRMRWREEPGLEPVYMEKDEVYEITLDLSITSWVIPAGHSLRFSVQSSNNPRFSVNPQNGLLLKDAAYPGDNITAVNTLHHSEQYPSRVTLPKVTKRQLPAVHVLKEVQTAYPDLTLEKGEAFLEGLTKSIKKKFSKKQK